jgi:hypothetical protein
MVVVGRKSRNTLQLVLGLLFLVVLLQISTRGEGGVIKVLTLGEASEFAIREAKASKVGETKVRTRAAAAVRIVSEAVVPLFSGKNLDTFNHPFEIVAHDLNDYDAARCNWKSNESLAGSCPGGLNHRVPDLPGVSGAKACAAACCGEVDCIVWQYRGTALYQPI